jgi:hypothetical protein
MIDETVNGLEQLYEDLPEYVNLANTDVNVVSQNMLKLASWSSAIGVVIALLILLAFLLRNRYGIKRRWRHTGNFITCSFVLVWLAGFVVYDLGMYVGEEGNISLFTNMPMAVIYSLEMFLLESDISAIHPPCFNNWLFMTAFSLVHMLAALVTLAFVIKHFGYNIIAGVRMLFESYFSRKKESYVFWGINDASYILAKSIKEHYKKQGRKDYRIVFVRTNQDMTVSVRNGMERLFNFLSLRNNDLDRLRKLDCLTTSTYADLARVKIESIPDDIMTVYLNLNMLARIIRNKTKDHAHLFFFSDNASDNIQAVANLKRDYTINAFVDKMVKTKDDAGNITEKQTNTITLYCRARYNSLHRVIEDVQLHDRIEVKVIDASHLSVEILKENVEFHPVSFVEIEKDATVSSPFNALIVGFGEVGKDMLRFLYEFSAFVKTGSGKNGTIVERSDFHCDVIDSEMPNQAGLFMVNSPSIVTNQTLGGGTSAKPAPIFLRTLDARSSQFYQELEQKINDLNYIVVAQGDDEQNVSLAVRIFRVAVRSRKDMNHFRILVLVKNDEDKQYSRVIEHYNRLWAAENHAEDKVKRINQHEIKTTEIFNTPITMFGKINEIYTHEYIIGDALKTKAQVYKSRYDKSIEAQSGQKQDSWETEHKKLMQLVDPYIGYSPTLSGIMRLRRIQRQNVENCFHQYTKQYLAQAALGDEYGVFAKKQLTRKEHEITYSWTDGKPNTDVTLVLDVLARTEHLRWVASHEVMGYQNAGGESFKDEARLLHGCLKDWEILSVPIQSYDYNVVDVSLGIMEPEE